MFDLSKSYESISAAFSKYQRTISTYLTYDVSMQNIYIQFEIVMNQNIFYLHSHNTHHYLEFFKAIRQNIVNDTLPSLLKLMTDQQVKYDLERTEKTKKQSDCEEISSISTESNQSPFKKLKNAAND